MNDLNKHLAPITDEAWSEIEEEATNTLTTLLAGRKLVDFNGPLGWSTSSVNLGRVQPLSATPDAGEALQANLRQVQPLVELKVPFTLSRKELDALDRGAEDAELEPVVNAAQTLARAEDRLIFNGWKEAGIKGIRTSSEHDALTLPEDATDIPAVVADALELIREAGVDGPYAAAVSAQAYNAMASTPLGSYTVLHFVETLLGGTEVVWAPSLEGGVVLSLRGGDFELVCGRDISIGYSAHDRESVELYLEESLTFRLLGPEAAVAIDAGG